MNRRSRSRLHSLLFPIPYSLFPLLILAACSAPFSDDDPDPTPTRAVTMATFTATEVVEPQDATATAQAQATAGVATATARAALATPTANPIPTTAEGTLVPPQARLINGSEQYLATFGSWSWQFTDQAASFVVIQAPAVILEEEITLQATDTLSLDIFGDSLTTLPIAVEVAAYDYEENQGVPVNPQTGEPSDEEAFAVKTDPAMSMTLSQVEQPFSLDELEPGHYALRILGRWGPHPLVPSRQIFVTWVFNVVVE